MGGDTTGITLGDSVVSFHNSQKAEVRGTLMHLSRQAVVIEVYNPWSIVQLSEVLTSLKIRRGERTVYDGRAVVSHLVNTGVMLIVSATLVDAWVLHDVTDARAESSRFVADWRAATAAITEPFRSVVGRASHFLEELSRWLAQGEADQGLVSGGPGAALPDDIQRDFARTVMAAVGPQIDELFYEFECQASTLPAELVPVHRAFAQRQLHPLILCSPFIHRTFAKPLGYAGDFEMVNMILRDPVEGGSTYARILNMCILGKDPAQAHRNRIEVLVERLNQLLEVREAERQRTGHLRPVRILNVACGPAMEIQRFLSTRSETPLVTLELLDFNADTLAWTKAGIERAQAGQRRPAEVAYIHKSIHTLLKEASRREVVPPDPPYDLVYCAGLFDYLGDRVCERLLALFAAWTRPGGLVLATNVSASNPIRCFMEHLLEWHLIYRTEAEFAALAPRGLPAQVTADSTGVNIFLEFRVGDARSG